MTPDTPTPDDVIVTQSADRPVKYMVEGGGHHPQRHETYKQAMKDAETRAYPVGAIWWKKEGEEGVYRTQMSFSDQLKERRKSE